MASEDVAEHQAALDELLAMPTRDVPRPCLATGLVWSAAAAYQRGDLSEVAALLARALDLLSALGEVSRALHVRTRYARTLAALGDSGTSTEQLGIACQEAVALGQFDLAAVCAAGLPRPLNVKFAPSVRWPLDGLAGWKTQLLWRSPIGRASRRLLTARTACTEGRLSDARAEASALFADVMAADGGLGDATVRVLCEAALTCADIALQAGDDATGWTRAAVEWADRAPPEDRPLLLALGRVR
jgi:hypothetical protein